MVLYQFRCEDCGILFEEPVDQSDSPVSCEFCQGNRVKKLFPVPVTMEDEDDTDSGPC